MFNTIDLSMPCPASCCPAPTPCVREVCFDDYKPYIYGKAKKKNMEDTMNTQTYTTINADCTDKNVTSAKNHLDSRIRQTFTQKDREIDKVFHISDDEAPKSVKDFMERIKSGKYVLPKKFEDEMVDVEEDDLGYFSPYVFMYQIRWRDPSVKEDHEGAKAARAKLTAAYESAIDVVKALDTDKGLAALNEFKAYTIQ